MATLPHQRAAAREFPDAVIRGVRPAVRFIADDPQDLPAGLLKDFALLLDGGRVHPIFGVADQFPRLARGGGDAVRARHGFGEHLLFWKIVAAKVRAARAVVAREGLLDDDVLAAAKRFDRKRLVGRAGRANVHCVHRVRERRERIEGAQPTVAGERLARFGGLRRHADDFHGYTVNPPVAFQMKARRKSRANDSNPDGQSHELSPGPAIYIARPVEPRAEGRGFYHLSLATTSGSIRSAASTPRPGRHI